jgi:hypothetical protein
MILFYYAYGFMWVYMWVYMGFIVILWVYMGFIEIYVCRGTLGTWEYGNLGTWEVRGTWECVWVLGEYVGFRGICGFYRDMCGFNRFMVHIRCIGGVDCIK